jgi:hypothetical protein
VVIDGQPAPARPGFHIFIDGNPPRIECYIRARRCQRCGESCNLWMTDDWRWRQLAPRWRARILCVACYRALTARR